ncbi:MAG: hypothetical protein ACWA41_04210 [Putridiphycobacter sp.]
MVRVILAILFVCTSWIGISQNANFNIVVGHQIFSNYSTVFDQGNYQFVYAAPFAKTQSEYSEITFNTPVYDQVRIVNIHGVRPQQRNNVTIGGAIRYELKNNFQFDFEMKYAYTNNLVFYSFQNMLINLDEDENYYSTISPDLTDDYITIKNWKNAYALRVNYLFNTKTVSKYFVSLGYNFQFLIGSTYSSYLTQNEETYLSEESTQDINEFYNTRVFQDRLFNELKNDGFNHIASLGIGVSYFGFQTGFDWRFALGESSNSNYYVNQNTFELYLKYKLFSVNTFK